MDDACIHLRLCPTSILDIYKVFEVLDAVSQTYGCALIPLHRPIQLEILDFLSLLEWKQCRYIMVEAEICLILIPTSILDI